MSNTRSVSDYPEHLNPFYEGNVKRGFWNFGKIKRSGSFGESFRNSGIFKSFIRKKKESKQTPSSSPELRQNVSTAYLQYRQTLPTPVSMTLSPVRNSVPLPRSRFSERVEKSHANVMEKANTETPCNVNKHETPTNPFDEVEKVEPYKLKRIRRKKRRAPLPPHMIREDGDNAYLGVSSMHNLSNWSLTSVETDISTYSGNENAVLDETDEEVFAIMNNITKEIEKMTDEIETKEIVDNKSNMNTPDLAVVPSVKVDKNDYTIRDDTNINSVDENSNFVSKIQVSDILNDSCDNEENGEQDNNLLNEIIPETHINGNIDKCLPTFGSKDQLNHTDSLTDILKSMEIIENVDLDKNQNEIQSSIPKYKNEVHLLVNVGEEDQKVLQDNNNDQLATIPDEKYELLENKEVNN